MTDQLQHDRRVDYVEFPVKNLEKTKTFYGEIFGWTFQDFGPEYTTFHDGRLHGGFRKEPRIKKGGPLVVIYAADLEMIQERILRMKGKIVKDTFTFPGGRRFHFTDPDGHTLAVWTDR